MHAHAHTHTCRQAGRQAVSDRQAGTHAHTHFGTKHNLTNHGFFTTFKIQGQCYHKSGRLLPISDEEPKFVKVYFMGNTQEEAKQRNRHVGGNLEMNIVTEVQEMLHQNHAYVSILKYALEKIALPDHKVIIRVDMRPSGEHKHHYNAPSVDEVAIILNKQKHGNRDIVLRKRCGYLNRISEIYCAYDSL